MRTLDHRHARRFSAWRGASILLLALVASPVARADDARPAEADGVVVVVANSAMPDSMKIAQHYIDARHLPPDNLIALPLSTEETVDRATFTKTLWEPLQDELMRRGWIEGFASDERDAIGRRKVAANGHHIRYLVTVFGVPLRVDEDPTIEAEPGTPPKGQFHANHAAVDAELSMLAWPSAPPVTGFVRNPLFANREPTIWDMQKVVRVSRLDGPYARTAMDLVDRALAGERDGLWGRYYVDSGGPHPEGDKWFDAAADLLSKSGMDGSWDRSKEMFGTTARLDAMSLYFGWYAGGPKGGLAQKYFQLAPGAIAMHLYSFSARSMRGGWAAWFVEHNAAATVGNVYEPYLSFCHRPDLMVEKLLAGGELGEAGYYSLLALSWQEVLIGDPLYRPFARSVADLRKDRDQLPKSAHRYVTLREVHALEEAGQIKEALAMATALLKDDRDPAVALACARIQYASGAKDQAADTVKFVRSLRPGHDEEWGVVAEIARQLDEWGDKEDAMEMWLALANYNFPNNIELEVLQQALPLAQAVGEDRKAELIQRKIDDLTPKPKPAADQKPPTKK